MRSSGSGERVGTVLDGRLPGCVALGGGRREAPRRAGVAVRGDPGDPSLRYALHVVALREVMAVAMRHIIVIIGYGGAWAAHGGGMPQPCPLPPGARPGRRGGGSDAARANRDPPKAKSPSASAKRLVRPHVSGYSLYNTTTYVHGIHGTQRGEDMGLGVQGKTRVPAWY